MQMRFRAPRWSRSACACGAMLLFTAGLPLALAAGQAGQNSSATPPARRDSVLSPEANRPPDANDQMLMREQKRGQGNFDAANALRRKQIDDEAQKLLILASDLHQRLRVVRGESEPGLLLREVAVIELLAHDIQARMTLTVGRQ